MEKEKLIKKADWLVRKLQRATGKVEKARINKSLCSTLKKIDQLY